MPNAENVTVESDARAIIEAFRKHGSIDVVPVGADDDDYHTPPAILSVPVGRKVESALPYIDSFLAMPRRPRGVVTLDTADSFTEFVQRFKDVPTVLFAKLEPEKQAAAMLAVFDYHRGQDDPTNENHGGIANWCQFRAHLPFRISPEWKAWADVDGKPMEQADFAEFIEEHVLDLTPVPTSTMNDGTTVENYSDDVRRFLALTDGKVATPQRVAELSRGLAVRAQVKAERQVNLSSGESRIVFEQNNEAADYGGPLDVPTMFLVAIPVFEDGHLYILPVRLRYAIPRGGGVVTWRFDLWGADRVFRHAVREAADAIQKATECPLVYGRPADRE